MEQLRDMYRDRVNIALILGGLRPGTKEPVTSQFREEILHHWRDVQAMTGQSFSFEHAMPEGFVYDTEPASRAVITVAELNPEVTFPCFSSIQSAFYSDNLDVTRLEQLQALAQAHGVDPKLFEQRFLSDEIRDRTQAHFHRTREFGVGGFPTLILELDDRFHLLTNGYRTLDALQEKLGGLLKD